MKPDQIIEKLLAAARAETPSGRVPFAFEKRIMARIAEQPESVSILDWSQWLWRAVVPYAAVAAIVASLSLSSVRPGSNAIHDRELAEIATLAIELPAE